MTKLRYIFIMAYCLMAPLQLQAQNITSGEYFFDTDPGVGKGTAITGITAMDSINYSFTVPVGSLQQGFHKLFTRVKNANNLWGMYETRTFYIQPNTISNPLSPLVAGEYFFDSDPGIGNGIAISGISSADSIKLNFTANLSDLNQGFHNLYVRVKNNAGSWSLYEVRTFYIQGNAQQDTLSPLLAGEYFFDSDPGIGNGIAISGISSADSIKLNFTANLSDLNQGFHNLYARVMNRAGRWSLYEVRTFYIQPSVQQNTLNTILQGEYFIDNDPGIGQGVPFSVPQSLDSVNLDISAATLDLPAGFHNLYVRVENSKGNWGLYEVRTFYVQPNVVTNSFAKLVNGEYFFDTIPEIGSGIPFSFTPSDSINISISPNLNGLSIGNHMFYIRVEDSIGNWSLVAKQAFQIFNCSTYPSASFLADTVCFGTPTNFTINNLQQNSIFNWNIDTSTNSFKSLGDTTYIISTAGIHKVTLQLTYSNGCMSDTTELVQVKQLPQRPVITFTGDTLYSNTTYGNQWYTIPGNALSGDTLQQYKPISNGVYYVEVTVNGCTSDSSNNLSIVYTGLSNLNSPVKMQFYPNPVNSVLNIQSPNSIYSVEVIDMSGKVVLFNSYSGITSQIQLDVSSLSKGTYLVRINSVNNNKPSVNEILKN